MLLRFTIIYVLVMPVLMLAFFVFALVAPQLGMAGGTGLLYGAIGSLLVALPVAWIATKKIMAR